MPKSVTLAVPSSSMRTFWGLTSRWTMPCVVRGAERAGDLDRVGDRLGDRQPAVAADAVLERLALDVLEDDVRAAVVLAGVDHADDVRVVELGDRARLAAEALELVGVRGDLAVHELDRDLALEHRVEGAVDRRHAAGADLGVEPVAAVEQGADLRAHRSIVRIVGAVHVRYCTDPACPWSWAAEPAVRRLQVEFGDEVAVTYVMGGLAREFRTPVETMRHVVPSMAGAQGARRPRP